MPSKLIPGEKETPVYKKSSPTKQFFGPTMGDPVNAGGGMGAGIPVDYGEGTAMYQKIKNTGTPPYKMKGSPHKLGTIEGTSAFKQVEEEEHFLVKKKQIPQEGFKTDEEGLADAKARALAKAKDLYDKDEITKKEYEQEKKRISEYVDW